MKKCIPTLLLVICVLPLLSVAQGSFNFYISNTGNDANAGTEKSAPRKTIEATGPLFTDFYKTKGSVSVGLKAGDTFNESLTTTYPVYVGTYADNNTGPNDFAILNGSREFDSGWIASGNSKYIFEQDIPYTGFATGGIGSYSYIYVTEINKALVKAAPFTAGKVMEFVNSLQALEATPGSFYSPVNTNENPKHVFIHPSNGSTPNANNPYGYEVTVRDYAVNSTDQARNIFENLWIHGFGGGIGMIPGGDHSYYNKIIFGPGAGIHHLVARGGTIDHSLFLPGAKNTNDFAVVFYDVDGKARHCTLKNSLFLDIPSPLYTHTSNGTNFGAVEMDNVLAFADTTNANAFMYTLNNDSVLLNKVYSDGYKSGYNYATAKYASIRNSCFKDVQFGIGYSPQNAITSLVDNIFIKTKGNQYTTGIFMQANTSLTLTNSIIHIVNNYGSYWPDAGAFIYGNGTGNSKLNASGNIFVCDIAPEATVVAAHSGALNGKGADTWNSNVYILLKGNAINWTTADAAANSGSNVIRTFAEWKRLSGQDQNSLFFDLRKDPRGLKAIFVDPANGNYDLAATPEGYQVAALGAGMTTAPNCFLQKPTYESAADLIKNGKMLSLENCRNPCEQNQVRINTSFNAMALNEHQVKISWNIPAQQNITRYELQRAVGNSVFNRLTTMQVVTDAAYEYVDAVQPGVSYQYRLVIADRSGDRCFSEPRSIKISDNKAFTIFPNPSPASIHVSMNGYIGDAGFTVLNTGGQIILKQQIFCLYNPVILKVSNQPKGFYFLKVETTKGTFVQKFSIQ